MSDADQPATTTAPFPLHWSSTPSNSVLRACRNCQHTAWCVHEGRCMDVLVSDDYTAWCMDEHRRSQEHR